MRACPAGWPGRWRSMPPGCGRRVLSDEADPSAAMRAHLRRLMRLASSALFVQTRLGVFPVSRARCTWCLIRMTGVFEREPGLLRLAFHDLRRSVEPTVVLSSLARLSVPCFSDRCALELSEGLDPVFKVSFSLPGEDPLRRNEYSRDDEPPTGVAETGVAVITAFDMASGQGHPSFSGNVIHSWTLRVPTAQDAVIAQLLLDHALEVVRYERLAEMTQAAEDRSARLAREAMANRSIGEAIGIEMVAGRLSRTAAIELLKDASRQSGRSLHEISVDVVRAATRSTPNSPEQRGSSVAPVINLEGRRLHGCEEATGSEAILFRGR